MTNIALIGHPGTGKTSIAEAWCRLVGGHVLGFSYALKDEVAEALAKRAGLMTWREYLAEMANPATKDKYRALLQAWGTDIRRTEDPAHWIKWWARNADNAPGPLAVDDCRFPNEHAELLRRGFIFVRLEDGDTTRPMGTLGEHESERYWPHFRVDFTLPYERGPEIQARNLEAMLHGY